ncbi:MAG: NAD-binding protein, partial [Sandaracinaceae bacterium]|nr:NAD-binding protein [Sandaracinaceae bacterium]
MRVIIVGGGVAGTELAHVLADDGHAVTLIDASPEVAKRGFTEHGITTFVGDGTEPRVLREADAGRA